MAAPGAPDAEALSGLLRGNGAEAARVRQALLEDGYCVLPGVLSRSEASAALATTWDYVEQVSVRRARRDRPATWQTRGARDPWPCTVGWSSFRDMFQSHQAGWVHSHVRELVAERVFEPLVFGTRELHCSKEGFTLLRPGSASHAAAAAVNVCGKPQSLSQGEHFDQPHRQAGLCHVQASVALTDQSECTGAFLCWPGSHRMHQELTRETYRGRHDWVPLCDEELRAMEAAGLRATRVQVCAGDVILWRSDLAHAAAAALRDCSSAGGAAGGDCAPCGAGACACGTDQSPPDGLPRRGWRAVCYVAMLPAALTPPAALQRKLDSYRRLKTGDHKANAEVWHDEDYECDDDPSPAGYLDEAEATGQEQAQPPPQQQPRPHDLSVAPGAQPLAPGTLKGGGGGGGMGARRRNTLWYPRGFFYKDGPPRLSWRLAELYGLVEYSADAGARAASCARAVAQGVLFEPAVLAALGVAPSPLVRWTPWSSHAREDYAVAGGARVEVLGREQLHGQDKWLGGVASACGRFVYGVPGTAPDVLRVHTATGEVERMAPPGQPAGELNRYGEVLGPLKGPFKWLRGVDVPPSVMGPEYPGGICLCLPCNHSHVLRIDPGDGAPMGVGGKGVSMIGGPYEGDWLWHGGNLCPDGSVICVPANATRVLRIDPRSGQAELIGPEFPGRQKWYGGLVSAAGCVYAVPQNASGVLKVNPFTKECTVIGEGTLGDGGWKWHGGVSNSEGTVFYGFPNNADHVLKVDTRSDTLTLLGGPHVIQSGRHRVPYDAGYKYLGGAIAPNACLYLFPCDAERVLCVNTLTDQVRQVGPRLGSGINKYQNGFAARDGAIYGISQRAPGILRIQPGAAWDDEPTIDELLCPGPEFEGKRKFEGGVMGADGAMYAIPLNATKVLKIVPGPRASGIPINTRHD